MMSKAGVGKGVRLRRLKVAAEELLCCSQWQLGELFVEGGRETRMSAKLRRDGNSKMTSLLSPKTKP